MNAIVSSSAISDRERIDAALHSEYETELTVPNRVSLAHL